MSTKVTLRTCPRTSTQPGFHLYEDCLDSLGDDTDAKGPVYLELEGVNAELRTLPTGGAAVLLTLPRELAQALGLVQLDARGPRTGNPSESF